MHYDSRNFVACLLFMSHYTLIYYTLNPFTRFGGGCAVAVYVGWRLNNNVCLLSQIEYHLFGRTSLGPTLKPISAAEKRILWLSMALRVLLWSTNQ
jgi:hypothetical protein